MLYTIVIAGERDHVDVADPCLGQLKLATLGRFRFLAERRSSHSTMYPPSTTFVAARASTTISHLSPRPPSQRRSLFHPPQIIRFDYPLLSSLPHRQSQRFPCLLGLHSLLRSHSSGQINRLLLQGDLHNFVCALSFQGSCGLSGKTALLLELGCRWMISRCTLHSPIVTIRELQ